MSFFYNFAVNAKSRIMNARSLRSEVDENIFKDKNLTQYYDSMHNVVRIMIVSQYLSIIQKFSPILYLINLCYKNSYLEMFL